MLDLHLAAALRRVLADLLRADLRLRRVTWSGWSPLHFALHAHLEGVFQVRRERLERLGQRLVELRMIPFDDHAQVGEWTALPPAHDLPAVSDPVDLQLLRDLALEREGVVLARTEAVRVGDAATVAVLDDLAEGLQDEALCRQAFLPEL